jgi:hypothetical protein
MAKKAPPQNRQFSVGDDACEVWVYDETDILTNLLCAIKAYKRKHGEIWPSKVVMHSENRLSFGLGPYTEILRLDKVLINALHFDLSDPTSDPTEGVREATVLPVKKRVTPHIEGYRRQRSDLMGKFTIREDNE